MKIFSDVQNLLKDEFSAVNQLILDRLNVEGQLIQEVSEHIIESGGKRTRPLLVLLTAKALGQFNDNHIKLAAIIEFIHTVTLLHDDVVDDSKLRHGKSTANFIWGNEASILVGDFLYSRAFQMMAELGHFEVIKVFADTTNKIAAGEVLQLSNRHDTEMDEPTYIEVIEGKTGALFEASTQLSAILAKGSEQKQSELANYGMRIGTAFQIIDDILDYEGKTNKLGKQVGDDLSEGKMTLPLIYAFKTCSPEQKKLIQSAIRSGKTEHLNQIIEIIKSENGLSYAKEKAIKETERAKHSLGILPSSEYKDALISITDAILERKY